MKTILQNFNLSRNRQAHQEHTVNKNKGFWGVVAENEHSQRPAWKTGEYLSACICILQALIGHPEVSSVRATFEIRLATMIGFQETLADLVCVSHNHRALDRLENGYFIHLDQKQKKPVPLQGDALSDADKRRVALTAVKDLETVILSGEEDESKQVVDVVLTHIVARQRTESKPSCAKGWGCDRNKNNRQCVEFGGGILHAFYICKSKSCNPERQ